MATAAQRLSDALVRHQIDIERLKKGTATRFVKLLRESDADMVAELRRRLDRFGATGPRAARKAKSLKNLIDAIIDGRRAVWAEIRREAQAELTRIARFESAVAGELLEDSIGLAEFEVGVVAAALFLPTTRDSVWLGRTTAQHLKHLELIERATIQRAIQQGVFEGLTQEQIVTGLVGSRGFGGADGLLQTTRNGLNSLMASATLNAIMRAQELLWADSGIITGLIWQAILDGRTTAICRSRDGFGVPFTDDFPDDIPLLIPPGARPPAHFNCRSKMEPTIRDIGVVPPHRTFVTDTRTNRRRRIDFRAEAKRREGDGWRNLTERQRRRRIRVIANEWAVKNIGTVGGQTTYNDFLRRQSARFQDSVLGPTRGKLYRQGGLTLQQFVDFTGKQFTLEQLAELHPRAFTRAGF